MKVLVHTFSLVLVGVLLGAPLFANAQMYYPSTPYYYPYGNSTYYYSGYPNQYQYSYQYPYYGNGVAYPYQYNYSYYYQYYCPAGYHLVNNSCCPYWYGSYGYPYGGY